MHLRTDDIAAAVGGTHHGSVVEVDGATIDSREVRGGELFVALVAERDGHQFVSQAMAAGAFAALCARRQPGDRTSILVDDTDLALLDLGRLARGRLPDRVIAVTGSVGKTTVKDLTAAALRTRHRTAASVRSFNNERGVPLTLVSAADDVEAVVVEMGARGRGHIALLCDVARPTVAVVTMVALAHAEMFGTIDEVAAAKGEVVEALPPEGTAVLNADDALVAAMAQRTDGTVVTFGVKHAGADVHAEAIALDDELRARFRLRSPWGDTDVRLGMRGLHQVGNALAAAAAAMVIGVEPAAVAEGLAGAELSPWRMSLGRSSSGVIVLNDAYNANPTSMAAALDALASLPARRRVAVLGVMAELGPDSDFEHRRVADYAEQLGIEVLAVAAPEYERRGVADVEAALDVLTDLGDGDAVLVKGSRVAGLETLADELAK
jgi:UDP-N-acetylmuramoyl-tripeptide--D-alanyl-D-alanine ligase